MTIERDLEKEVEKYHLPYKLKMDGEWGTYIGVYNSIIDGQLFVYRFPQMPGKPTKYGSFSRREINEARLDNGEWLDWIAREGCEND